MVGSIRDIQEQKEQEAEQLRQNTIDGMTGLYVFSAGMERLQEYRTVQQNGVMLSLYLDQLQESNEKNGIVFGDMILEGIGSLIRSRCKALAKKTGGRTVALRLNGDEFVVWLENQPREQAAAFTRELLEKIAADFEADTFSVHMYAGLACGNQEQSAEQLISRAKLAQSMAACSGQS